MVRTLRQFFSDFFSSFKKSSCFLVVQTKNIFFCGFPKRGENNQKGDQFTHSYMFCVTQIVYWSRAHFIIFLFIYIINSIFIFCRFMYWILGTKKRKFATDMSIHRNIFGKRCQQYIFIDFSHVFYILFFLLRHRKNCNLDTFILLSRYIHLQCLFIK